jgi:type I restriction enzyme S subunit
MWPVSPLGETLDVLHRYPTFYGTTYVEHGVPVARIGNILSSNTLDPDLSNYVRVPHDFSADFPRTLLKLGDLVMAVRGDTTGKVGIVPPSLEGANISPNLIRLSPNTNKILSEYLLWLLLITPSLIASNITDTAKKSITAENIGRIGIRVPPLQLQKEFAQRVTEIRALEAAQAASRQRLEALFQSMLHRAFNGEF